jgi:hypothetical protein
MRKLNRKAKNDYGKAITQPDVRPLDKREIPLNTRKGMPKAKCKGFFDTGDYKQMNLYDEMFL